jgi:selenocysteine lyase/cysteine desulfurase
MIYLDNAATSWPKPAAVTEAMAHFLRDVGASPGRSGHRLANEAERIRFEARELLASLFGLADPLRVIFTHNATAALNLVIRGLLTPGTHVITTGMEHNAVMRPLSALAATGVSVTILPCAPDGTLDPTLLDQHVRTDTRLVICNHASNVCGTVLPIRALGARAHAHGLPLLVDAAQTAGVWPINLHDDNVDLLAFTGHKGLLGPTGTGGHVIHDDFDIARLPRERAATRLPARQVRSRHAQRRRPGRPARRPAVRPGPRRRRHQRPRAGAGAPADYGLDAVAEHAGPGHARPDAPDGGGLIHH